MHVLTLILPYIMNNSALRSGDYGTQQTGALALKLSGGLKPVNGDFEILRFKKRS
jgi:hypothetical protein